MEIGICDDEMEVCLSLAKKIRAQIPDADLRLFTSGEELLEADHKPDLLFLDIRMEGIDGMEAARKLREAEEDLVIIFISGCADHVFDAFDVDAAHYLVKPFDEAKLRQVIRKADASLRRRRDEEPRLVVSRRGQHTSVCHRNIQWAEVFNRTVVLHTSRGDVSYYGRLTDLEKELGEDFFRTHRAYLVNCRFVDSYDARSVQIGGDRIPVAKANHAAFVEHYMQYVRRQGRTG